MKIDINYYEEKLEDEIYGTKKHKKAQGKEDFFEQSFEREINLSGGAL